MNYFNSKTINLMMYLDELHLYLNSELIFFIDFHYIHIIVNFYIKSKTYVIYQQSFRTI